MKNNYFPLQPKVFPLFTNRWGAWLLLPLRLWLGWEWLSSGWGKLFNPAWVETGASIRNYWLKAVVVVDGKGPIAYDWYRSFIQFLIDSDSHVWFSKLVVLGELSIGIALILGAFVGVAAFFGALMNWNFMMAGSAGVNPLFFVVEIFLMLGWRVAGYIGADYFLLGWIRKIFRGRRKV